MARELELLNYEATMVYCSNYAIKLLIWWGNNIGGGTMLISENELKESADLAIAYWKKQSWSVLSMAPLPATILQTLPTVQARVLSDD